VSRHTVTCAGGGDSNWPIVPDCALRRCTTGFMLSHKLSVSQYSHLALALRLAQRHCAAVRGRARPPELRGNSVAANRHFFFVRSAFGRRLRQVWAPTAPQLARVPRCATRPTASDPPASHVLPAARAGAALCKCGVAVQPGHGGQH
jgi:hypothetical protein